MLGQACQTTTYSVNSSGNTGSAGWLTLSVLGDSSSASDGSDVGAMQLADKKGAEESRSWTIGTGKNAKTILGKLVGVRGNRVIIQPDGKGKPVSVNAGDLSREDQRYVAKKQSDSKTYQTDEVHTKDGKLNGKVVLISGMFGSTQRMDQKKYALPSLIQLVKRWS